MGNSNSVLKVSFSILLIISCFPQSRAQTISSISNSICDSINKLEYSDEAEMASLQLGIYHKELVKYPTLIVDITNLNKPRQFNEFNYRINRELLQTCPNFIDQFSLLPLSKILDLENLFNDEEYDSLERAIVEFIFFNKMDMVVLTIDDNYPYKDLKEYSRTQLNNWKIGARYERGGVIIAVNTSSGSIEIGLSNYQNDFITEEFIQEVIESEVRPSFSEHQFFKGIMACINALSKS